MLILTRKPGERIFIGDKIEICITILCVERNQIRIGIDAEKDIPILREEVYLRKMREKNDEIWLNFSAGNNYQECSVQEEDVEEE